MSGHRTLKPKAQQQLRNVHKQYTLIFFIFNLVRIAKGQLRTFARLDQTKNFEPKIARTSDIHLGWRQKWPHNLLGIAKQQR